MPFNMFDIPGEIQRGKQFKARNTLNDLAIQQSQNQAADQQGLRNALGRIGANPTREDLAGLNQYGVAGVQAGQGVKNMLGTAEDRQKQARLLRAQQLYSLVNSAKDQASYDAVRAEAMRENPEMGQRLPETYDPNIVGAMKSNFEGVIRGLGGNVGARTTDPASVQEYMYRQNLPGGIGGEADQTFLAGKRANQVINLGGSQRVIGPSGEDVADYTVTPKPTETPEYKANVAKAIKDVESLGKEAEKQRSNDTAYQVYRTAMDNVSETLGQTSTGSFVGLLPALTADAKTAQGAIAIIAPVLKTMFRASGEGTFTDKDQELLLDMVPKRTDPPPTREAKTRMIDSVVQAKLGQNTPESQDNSANAPRGTQDVDDEIKALEAQLGL